MERIRDYEWKDSFPAPGPKAAVRIIIDQHPLEGKRYCFTARTDGTEFSPAVTLEEFREYLSGAIPAEHKERLWRDFALDHPGTLIEVEVLKDGRYVLHSTLKQSNIASPVFSEMVIAFNYPDGNDAARMIAEGHVARIRGCRAIACPRDPKGTWPAVEQVTKVE